MNRLLLVLTIILLAPIKSFATHAAGLDLTYEYLGLVPGTTDQYQYVLTAKFYYDCDGAVSAPSQFTTTSSNSCGLTDVSATLVQVGTPTLATPICPSYLTTCDGGTYPGIEEYVYVDTIILTGQCADWTFGIDECCRQGTITNLQNPGGDWIYVEAVINNTQGWNSSPVFTNQPISFICTGQYYCYNNGAYDPDGDSLAYVIIDPMTSNIGVVTYLAPYSNTNPFDGTTTFDSFTGNLCVTPASPQVTVVAIRVEEYRNGVLIGSVVRDIQVAVENCPGNNTPLLSGLDGLPMGPNNMDTTFCPGDPISLDIFASDIDLGDSLNINVVSNNLPGSILNISNNNTISPTANISWNTTVNDTSTTPYTLTLSVNDNACPYNAYFTVSYNVIIIGNVTNFAPVSDVCVTEAPFALTQGAPAGGTYTGTAVNNGVFDPNAAGPGTHTITYDYQNIYGCSGTDTQTITVEDAPDAGLDGSTTLCDNASAFSLFDLLGGTPSSNGNWTNSSGNTSPSVFNPSSQLSDVFTYSVLGTVCPSDSARVDVTIHQMPVANAGNDTAICGSTYNMLAIPSVGVGSWSNSSGVNIADLNNENTITTTSNYGTHQFTWTEDNNGCISSDDVFIEYIDPPFNLDITPSSYTMCPEENVTLHIDNVFDNYLWHRNNIAITGSNSNTYTTTKEGSYTVLVSNSICSALSPPAEVNIIELLDPSILTRLKDVCPIDPPIAFEAVTNNGVWSGDGISRDGIFNPSSAGVGEHWISYTLDYNCNEKDSILIELGCELSIFVPNTFTPNGDEHNEFFVLSSKNLESFEFRIYNRWGDEMFSSQDINYSWDGKFNNQIVPAGVYSYYLKAYGKDDQTVTKNGTINVLR